MALLSEAREGKRIVALGKPCATAIFQARRSVRLVGIMGAGKRIDNAAIGTRIEFCDRLLLRVTSPEIATLVGRVGLEVGVRRRRNLAGPDLGTLFVRAGDRIWIRTTE